MTKRILIIVSLIFFASSVYAVREKNVIKFGRDIYVEETRVVRGAATVIGNIIVNGTVEDDVVAVGGSVKIGPKAHIGGNVVSVGGFIERNKTAAIEGNIVEVNVPVLDDMSRKVSKSTLRKWYWELKFVSFLGFLMLALLCVAVIPKPLEIVSDKIKHRTIYSLSWSLRGLTLLIPLAVILTMSVAGIFLIPLEVILVVAASIFGYIAVANVVGEKLSELISNKKASMYFCTTIGFLIFTIIGFVPVVGWILKAVASILGFGAVLAAFLDKKKTIPETVIQG